MKTEGQVSQTLLETSIGLLKLPQKKNAYFLWKGRFLTATGETTVTEPTRTYVGKQRIHSWRGFQNWGLIFTCVGVNPIIFANDSRSGADKYFWWRNRRSSSYVCAFVKRTRLFRFLSWSDSGLFASACSSCSAGDGQDFVGLGIVEEHEGFSPLAASNEVKFISMLALLFFYCSRNRLNGNVILSITWYESAH